MVIFFYRFGWYALWELSGEIMGGNEKTSGDWLGAGGFLFRRDGKQNSDLQRYTEGRIRINKLFLDSKIISTPVNRLIRKEVLTENAIYFRSGILFEDFLWCYFLYKKVETFASVNSFTYFYRRSNPFSTMNKAKTDFDKPAKDFILSWLFLMSTWNRNCMLKISVSFWTSWCRWCIMLL